MYISSFLTNQFFFIIFMILEDRNVQNDQMTWRQMVRFCYHVDDDYY